MAHTIPTRTARLALSRISFEDVDDLYGVYGDPATWEHLPSGRHRTRSQSEALVVRHHRSWESSGLGPWALRIGAAGIDDSLAPGMFIGSGGVSMTESGVWNLGYRLSRESWGRGLATEVAHAGVRAAVSVRPHIPVTARVLSTNPASCAVALRAGLTLVHERPADASRAGGVTERIYADRELTRAQLVRITSPEPTPAPARRK
ncbi:MULTISPECIES: GNAT family N-acetyltransferase [unclassified Microbacterium]|uniref:GNAT family N-acetyltransferase n=1 Tax=unclassified Microbacterium TaxID=2609290 RepID=UPI003864D17C